MDLEIEKWKKRFEKERQLRKQVDRMLEEKTRSLYETQLELKEKLASLDQSNLELTAIEEELRQNIEELQTVTEDREKAMNALEYLNQELEQRVKQRTEELANEKRKILSSINYARRIQDALLPNLQALKEYLPNSFVFHESKDIVSGDFLWYTYIDQQLVIAVVDCTGHGVPGAFMSLIASEALFRIVKSTRITTPDIVLTSLNFIIKKMLRQGGSSIQDGMDMAICSIDFEQNKLEFAGAKRPLIYIKNNELFEIKGDRFPIGGISTRRDVRYTNHRLHLDSPMSFYLFTDGYYDQFGGALNKKYMAKRFKKLLLNNSTHSFPNQQLKLKHEFHEWKDQQAQTDDVMVLGFELFPMLTD